MTNEAESIRVAIYRRVSMEEAATEGFSLGAQDHRLRAYAESQAGLTITNSYVDDGRSGRNTQRAGYQQMMKERDEWDMLLVVKMDRIHRNSRNFMEMMDTLNDDGKGFASVSENLDTSNSMGRFVMDIIQRIAQLESEQIGERVLAGMEQKLRLGPCWVSMAPFGYRLVNGNLEPDPAESKVVLWMFRAYAKGLSTRDIASALNGRGVRTKRANKWKHYSVLCVLKNRTYLGERNWRGTRRQENHPAIVGPVEFHAAQEARVSSYKGAAKYAPSADLDLEEED